MLKDTALTLPPVSETRAKKMIKETAIGKVLKAKYPASIPKLAVLIQKVGTLVAQHPEIKEIGTSSPSSSSLHIDLLSPLFLFFPSSLRIDLLIVSPLLSPVLIS